MSVINTVFRGIYFGAQRLRGGVTREMIRNGNGLLDSPRHTWQQHILDRLREVHGVDVDWDWLRSTRPVERSTLLPTAEELLRSYKGFPRPEIRRTSGSTGIPFRFPKDPLMSAWMDAAMWSVYAWHGITPGLPSLRFWGAPTSQIGRMKTCARDYLLHRRRISAFDLSPVDLEARFRDYCRLQPRYAYGYPTLMRSFADLCRERHIDGKDLGLKLVISTGELLTESARSHLREFFGCRVVDEYGCTESGILAFECEFGTMHTIPVAAYAEILSREEGDCQMDLEGEVVVSDLFGELLPLLKYRLHDRGHVSDASCRCGRELPALSIKSGRIDSFIETPRGKIYDAILAYTVPREVQRFKVYQTDENHLRAHIVTRPQWGDHDIATKCKLIWEEVIGPEMVVSVEVVDDIPLEDSGKLRYFVPLRGG